MRFWLTFGFLVCRGGCLGKVAPGEQYLNVLSQNKPCAEIKSEISQLPIVGVKKFKASPALDRQAVMMAEERVLTASTRWYWEADPGTLLSQAFASELGCSGDFTAAWPLRWRSRPDMVLAGQVTNFEVRLNKPRVAAAITCQLWDGDETKVLGEREFSVEVDMARITPQEIAQGASQALNTLTGQAVTWLRRLQTKQTWKKVE